MSSNVCNHAACLAIQCKFIQRKFQVHWLLAYNLLYCYI